MKIITNIFAFIGFSICILFLLGSIGIGNFALLYHSDIDKITKDVHFFVFGSQPEIDKQIKCMKNKE